MARDPVKQSIYFKDWYARNKERIKQQKKERYKNDKDYKERIKTRAEFSYWSEKEGVKKNPKKQYPLYNLRVSCMEDIVIKNPLDVRFGEKVRTPVYSMFSISKMFGIQMWEVYNFFADGSLIDFRFSDNSRRGATLHQMMVLDKIKGLAQTDDATFASLNKILSEMQTIMVDKVFPLYRMRNKVTGVEDLYYVFPSNKTMAVKLTMENDVEEAYLLEEMEILNEN